MIRPAVLDRFAALVLVALAGAAVLLTLRLGPMGLLLLGLATWLVCTLAALDDQAPTWGVHVFKARMERPRSDEARAARRAERDESLSPLGLYRRCGIGLVVAGAAGFAWSVTHGG